MSSVPLVKECHLCRGISNNKQWGPQPVMENGILNILTSSDIHHSYPTLQKDAVNAIASCITDIVYTTASPKNAESCTNRTNLLKLANRLCHTPEFHSQEGHYKVYLQAYQHHCIKTGSPELLNITRREPNERSSSVYSELSTFYRRKNGKSKTVISRLELIKQMDEERLKPNFSFSKSVSHYETSQGLIDDLLEDPNENCTSVSEEINLKSLRKRQVGFCYALVNIAKEASDLMALDGIFRAFSSYTVLRSDELQLLTDIWMLKDYQCELRNKVSTQFPFIVENIVIRYCTDIVKLKDASEVAHFFCSLSSDTKFVQLQEVCAQNRLLLLRIKTCILQLHVYSVCNRNIYRFFNYISSI